jgi:hypothetical protein
MPTPPPDLVAARLMIERQRVLIAQLRDQIERSKALSEEALRVLQESYEPKR